MSALDILEQLENTSGSSAKLAILQSANNNPQLKELLDAALNFKRKFYIKKFTLPEQPSLDTDDKHDDFFKLLHLLETRLITGDNAKNSVENFMSSCNSLSLKWYSRVLKKNLQIGIDISTANKAGFNIPDFDVMLAKDGKKCKKVEEIVKKGVYLSPKFDGYRCIAICDHGHVTLHSRNGSMYENFPAIIESLEKLCPDSRFILDGEIMSDSFNKMQQTAFASKRGTTVGDVRYYVFGWIAYDEWENQRFSTPTRNRLENLAELLKHNGAPNIHHVPHKLVYKLDDILQFEQECLVQGHEGVMILPNIPYYLGKKSNRLLKFKTFKTQDCTVTGVYEGKEDGKYVGTLGGITVVQENGLTCNCGSGFSDAARDYMWKHPEEFIGRIAECSYQELTDDDVMRFPTFVRWRDMGPGMGKI